MQAVHLKLMDKSATAAYGHICCWGGGHRAGGRLGVQLKEKSDKELNHPDADWIQMNSSLVRGGIGNSCRQLRHSRRAFFPSS